MLIGELAERSGISARLPGNEHTSGAASDSPNVANRSIDRGAPRHR
ncbi:hypothetical protein MA6G0125R_1759 [Mycobacteroides abscessus 6G-0125-R]|nr:hypothetical protein MA6G0125R_1759 [Mycobacteroides abscessus 6G-0125-R]EIU46607.1 hypothetical protein MA6G0125S_2800 [Mycobacteroides abscessus 6G-0125-S]